MTVKTHTRFPDQEMGGGIRLINSSEHPPRCKQHDATQRLCLRNNLEHFTYLLQNLPIHFVFHLRQTVTTHLMKGGYRHTLIICITIGAYILPS